VHNPQQFQSPEGAIKRCNILKNPETNMPATVSIPRRGNQALQPSVAHHWNGVGRVSIPRRGNQALQPSAAPTLDVTPTYVSIPRRGNQALQRI